MKYKLIIILFVFASLPSFADGCVIFYDLKFGASKKEVMTKFSDKFGEPIKYLRGNPLWQDFKYSNLKGTYQRQCSYTTVFENERFVLLVRTYLWAGFTEAMRIEAKNNALSYYERATGAAPRLGWTLVKERENTMWFKCKNDAKKISFKSEKIEYDGVLYPIYRVAEIWQPIEKK